jgi:two-component system sensor histidine kinase KdpD
VDDPSEQQPQPSDEQVAGSTGDRGALRDSEPGMAEVVSGPPEGEPIDEWEADWEAGTEAVRRGVALPLKRPYASLPARLESAARLSQAEIEAATSASMEEIKSKVARKRGRLKIFLGMAPGVGKTYTMLSEAHRRKSRGEDIVVGYVEGHARPETQELVVGLEIVPRKRIEYRGRIFEEMDTAAVIARDPEWALVDELAHTNVPGAGHPKRWQSINDILDAGINVISTVNVQHLESLNDTIADITGTRVRETFPDHFLDEADEVVVVDITPEALMNRLRRGAVYDSTKVDKALMNFFTPEKLSALRELALRRTAEEVDEELHALEGDGDNLHASDAVLVTITPREVSQRLIRRGYRIAERMQGSLYVVHVETTEHPLTAKDRGQLDPLFELARDLGAEVCELKGESVAAELVDFAKEQKVTWVVMGQSVRSRMKEIIRGSIVTKIMRELHGVDVVIIADPEQDVAEG